MFAESVISTKVANEVRQVCVSNNFIEQQTYKIAEEIRENSLYNLVRVDYSGCKNIGFEKPDEHGNNYSEIPTNGADLITKIILEDKVGTLYSVEPNIIGLKFAKGEISYAEYCKLQRKNDKILFFCFLGIIAFFSVSMFIFSKLIY